MKKYIFILSVILLATACTDDEKLFDPADDIAFGTFAQLLSSEGDAVINKLDPANSSFVRSYEIVSEMNGSDANSVNVYVSFADRTPANGNSSAAEQLLTTINSSSFTQGTTYPSFEVMYNGQQFLDALSLAPTDIDGSDIFNTRLEIVTDRGTFSTTSANFEGQSADHTLPATVICDIEPALLDGDWTIDMQDSYGDGWQTTTGDGGPGLSFMIDGVDHQVGLCSTLETPSYDCFDDGSSGTSIVTVPANAMEMVITFPGDTYGEISFTIKAPSGNVVASYAAGSSAGPVALNLCNETP